MVRIVHVLIFIVLSATGYSVATDLTGPSKLDLAKSELRRYVYLCCVVKSGWPHMTSPVRHRGYT